MANSGEEPRRNMKRKSRNLTEASSLKEEDHIKGTAKKICMATEIQENIDENGNFDKEARLGKTIIDLSKPHKKLMRSKRKPRSKKMQNIQKCDAQETEQTRQTWNNDRENLAQSRAIQEEDDKNENGDIEGCYTSHDYEFSSSRAIHAALVLQHRKQEREVKKLAKTLVLCK